MMARGNAFTGTSAGIVAIARAIAIYVDFATRSGIMIDHSCLSQQSHAVYNLSQLYITIIRLD